MKKIVVLGAGYAGLKTVIALQKKIKGEAKIILINDVPYHYEAMRLYEVASGNGPYTGMSYELSDVLDPAVTELVVDDVVKIDIENKKVELKNNAPIDYDYCVVGLGFTQSSLGIEGAKENGLPMYNVPTAQAIDKHIEMQMKRYKSEQRPEDLNIIICGAGFQAIEVSGAISEARPRYAKIAGVNPDQIEIQMFDGSPRLLPMFNDKLVNYELNVMNKRNINVLYPAYIQKVTSDSVFYKMADAKKDDKAKEFKAGTIIWLMGFSGSPVIEASGFKNRRNRVMVGEHLTAPESDDIYVLGDSSSVMVPGKKWPYPNTGQMALSMANYTAKDIAARVLGHSRPTAYTYKSLGEVATVGEDQAVGKALGMSYKGYLASALKKIIIDKSLMETGGIKETLAVGRFDFYR